MIGNGGFEDAVVQLEKTGNRFTSSAVFSLRQGRVHYSISIGIRVNSCAGRGPLADPRRHAGNPRDRGLHRM